MKSTEGTGYSQPGREHADRKSENLPDGESTWEKQTAGRTGGGVWSAACPDTDLCDRGKQVLNRME